MEWTARAHGCDARGGPPTEKHKPEARELSFGAVVSDDELVHLGGALVGQDTLQIVGVPHDRIRLLRSFDPRSGAHALDVEDPYYGAHAEFEETFEVIEASLPGLHEWVDEQLAARGRAS